MSKAYSKKISFDDGTTAVTLGASEVKHDLKNKLTQRPLAQEQAGEQQSVAINLNRIIEQYEITAHIDDEVAGDLNPDVGADTFTGDGTTTTFSLSQITGNDEVFIDGNFINSDRYELDEQNTEITFDVAPADGASIEVRHELTKEDVKDNVLSIFRSQAIIEFTYGSETPDGYIDQISITERAQNDNIEYEMKIRFLKTDAIEAI